MASGDRCRDLSVRLHYAGVTHMMEEDPLAALRCAHGGGAEGGDAGGPARTRVARVDVIGNYTAFNELLGVSARPAIRQAGPVSR